MPSKDKPGTPSMSAGRMIPCQWMEVRSRSLLVTRMVTSSPWRMRSVGPGSRPLTTTAWRAAPVKFTGKRIDGEVEGGAGEFCGSGG